MAGGTIIVSACLLVLGWTSEIVGTFVTDKETVQYPTRGFGIWIWCSWLAEKVGHNFNCCTEHIRC